MNKKETSDIVVIGAGAVGAAVASYLAEDGHQVSLVESGDCAWGTSRRCEGHIATYDTVPGYYSQLCSLGQNMIHDLGTKLDYDIHLETIGLGLLVDNEDDMDSLMQHAQGKKAEGVPCNVWNREELLHNEPNIGDSICACLNFTNELSVNPMRLTYAFCHNAQKHKAKLHMNTKVLNIVVKDNAVQSVVTDKGEIFTKKIVVAAGVWTSHICHMMGITAPIRPRQGMLLVTERVKGLLGKNYVEYGYLAAKGGKKRPNASPAMEEFGVASTFEPTYDGTLIMGSSRRFAGLDSKPHPAVIQAIAQRSITFFPKLKDIRLMRTYAGVRPYSPDGKPIVSDTHINGVYIAAGHEGNGIGLSAITGKMMAQLIAGQTPLMDMSALHIDRFGCNPLVHQSA